MSDNDENTGSGPINEDQDIEIPGTEMDIEYRNYSDVPIDYGSED